MSDGINVQLAENLDKERKGKQDLRRVQTLDEGRSEHNTVYLNADGSKSLVHTLQKSSYKDKDGKWQSIDVSLVEDKATGKWRTKANAWNVTFGELAEDGITINKDGQTFSFRPTNAANVKPQISGDAPNQVVTYRNAWQGVDLRYKVSGSQLKEDIIIKSRAASSSFDIETSGANLKAAASSTGAFSLDGAFAGFTIAAPTVITADRAAIDGKAPVSQSANGNVLTINLDKDWLEAQPLSAFPVVIDPTISVGVNYYDLASDGFICAGGNGCGNTAGREAGGKLWRFAYNVNYTIPSGTYLVSAKLHLEKQSGTAGTKPITVNHSACTSTFTFGCYDNLYGQSSGQIDSIADIDVTTVYRAAVEANNLSPWMMVRGDESAESFKQFDETKTSVTLNFEKLPSSFVAGSGSPANEGTVITTQPTFFTDPGSIVDSDGPGPYQYRFIIGTVKNVPQTTNPFNLLPSVTGLVADSGRQPSNQWTVPDNVLQDGQTYYWQPLVWDKYQDAPDVYGPVYSFRVDLRNGKDATQAYDTVGPVNVDLATGNLNIGTKTHGMKALSEDIALSLDYNSPQRSRQGLVGEYWNDPSATRVFPSSTAPLVRVDPNVNFNWGTDGPSTGIITPDNFLAKWSGYFVAPQTATYQFGTVSDNGVRIRINGTLNLDAWTTSNPNGVYGTGVALTAGQVVPIVYEYAEWTGNASTQLWVKTTSGSIAPQLMDPSWLQTGVRPIATPHGLVGRYYTDNGSHTFSASPDDPTRLFLTRTDSSLNQNWGGGSPVPGGPADNFMVRWTGFFTAPVNDTYTFGAGSDDGVRIKINGSTTVVDSWSDHGASPIVYAASGTTLTAGQTIPITIEYYENTGSAQMALFVKRASLPSAPDTVVPSTWLSPDAQILPDGWNLGIDGDGNLRYDYALIGQGSVLLYDSAGQTHEYKFVNGGYTPPTGEVGHMVRNGDGTVTLQDGSGRTYIFNPDGTIKSVTMAVDDRNPAALQYTYSGTPSRLTQITDGVNSGRWLKLWYGNDPSCPTPPAGFLSSAPANMICGVTTSDGNITKFFYKNDTGGVPRLYRLELPGSEITDYDYDATPGAGLGRIVSVRDKVANDAIVAGVRAQDNNVLTQIGYDALGKANSVTMPAATTGATRMARTYEYQPLAGYTNIHVTGATEPNGFTRKVTYDATFRTTTDTDIANLATQTEWHPVKDIVLSTIDPAGLKSTILYDYADRPVDTYGPAPQAWFNATTRLPLTSPTDYTPQIPHTKTGYDESIGGNMLDGLASAYYNVDSFANGTGSQTKTLFGSPKLHATGVGTANGDVVKNWGGTPPITPDPGKGWGARLSGWIHLTAAGNHIFKVKSDDGARLWIDDQIIVNDWADGVYRDHPTGVFNNTSSPADSWHRVRLDYYNKAGDTDAHLQLLMTEPGGSETSALGSLLKPGYGLVTSQKTFDSSASVGDVTTTTCYGSNPELGLVHSKTVDPTGLNLTTANTYETQGAAGSFLRQTSNALPGGATTNYSYYTASETRDNPCTPAVEAFKQAGLAKLKTEPDPDGVGAQTPVTTETVYDDSGREVAKRFNNESSWTCLTYDARGRLTQKAIPANSNGSARTVNYNYAEGGNPLVTSTTEGSEPPLITTTDLLGRTISYKDRNNTTVTPTTTTYDNLGRLISRSGKMGTEEFVYDNLNRLTSQKLNTIVIATPTYDAYGRLQQVSFPRAGQLKQVIGRDSLGRINNYDYTLGNGTTHHIDTVTYSQSGKVLSGTELATAKSYTYDKASRLANATIGANTYAYSFAAPSAATCNQASANLNAHKSGNRTSQTVNGITTTYCYDHANRLITSSDAGITNPTYDTHGNTSSIGQVANPKYVSFGYDSSDRTRLMHQIYGTTGNKWITQYEYDAEDRLRSRFEDNGPAPSIWESFYGYTTSDSTPDYEMDNAWNVRERYIQMPGGVLFTIRSTASSFSSTSNVYSLPNIHGDTMVTANGAGTQIGTFNYEPFGKITNATKPDNANGRADFAHLGQHQKQTEVLFENQPQLMGARVYMSIMGRFTQVDPVEGASSNEYVYPEDSVNENDVTGQCPICIGAVVLALRAYPAIYLGIAAFTETGAFKSTPKLGQAAHKQFTQTVISQGGKKGGAISKTINGKTVRGIPDGFRGNAPLELKPHNTRAIKLGVKQLQRYEKIQGVQGELWTYQQINGQFVFQRIR